MTGRRAGKQKEKVNMSADRANDMDKSKRRERHGDRLRGKRAGTTLKMLLALLLSLVLVAGLFTACGSSQEAAGGSGAAQNASVSEKAEGAQQSGDKKDSSQTDKKHTEKAKENKDSKAADKQEKTKTADSTDKSAAKTSSGKNSAKTKAKSTSAGSKNTSAKSRCTIMIDASRYKAGKRILSKQTVNIKKGDTVKSILLRECSRHGIAVSVKGDYVEGIAGIFEFDGGDRSGWMYSVNGRFPQTSCGSYKVRNGDNIQWRYMRDMGNDL